MNKLDCGALIRLFLFKIEDDNLVVKAFGFILIVISVFILLLKLFVILSTMVLHKFLLLIFPFLNLPSFIESLLEDFISVSFPPLGNDSSELSQLLFFSMLIFSVFFCDEFKLKLPPLSLLLY